MFVTAFFWNIQLSNHFHVHYIIINWTDSYNFQQFQNILSLYLIIIPVMTNLPHMWITYRTSTNSLCECYPPHTSSTQVSDGKALIPFWIKKCHSIILVIIKAHTLLITLYVLHYTTKHN
jgi:hypothetical protein